MANIDCSKIAAGLTAAACGTRALSGLGSRVILLNYSDIDKTASTVTSNIVSAITLAGTAVGYEFTSLPDTMVAECTFERGTYMGSWVHSVNLRVFTKSETSKAFINSLNDARLVAIVANNEAGTSGEIKYEVYGWESGLKLETAPLSSEVADGLVADIKMSSTEGSKESTIQKSVFITSLTATESMLTALLS